MVKHGLAYHINKINIIDRKSIASSSRIGLRLISREMKTVVLNSIGCELSSIFIIFEKIWHEIDRNSISHVL